MIADPYTAEFGRGNPRLTNEPNALDERYGRVDGATALAGVTAEATAEEMLFETTAELDA